jgi:uncharacterized protein
MRPSCRAYRPSEFYRAGEAYFVLGAANNQVIGTSEMYASKQMRDKGIEAVKATAPTAIVVDRR